MSINLIIKYQSKKSSQKKENALLHGIHQGIGKLSSAYGIRTRVTGVKGQRPNH